MHPESISERRHDAVVILMVVKGSVNRVKTRQIWKAAGKVHISFGNFDNQEWVPDVSAQETMADRGQMWFRLRGSRKYKLRPAVYDLDAALTRHRDVQPEQVGGETLVSSPSSVSAAAWTAVESTTQRRMPWTSSGEPPPVN